MTETDLILKTMLEKDSFSRWMGIEVDECRKGYCKLHYTIREDMLNGFGTVHGGVIFSAADSALAFVCNTHGKLTVALDVHISFVRSAKAGEVMTVEATEMHRGNKVGFYNIVTTNEKGELAALFKGTAYNTGKDFLPAT